MQRSSKKFDFTQVWNEYRTLIKKDIEVKQLLELYEESYNEYKKNEQLYEDRTSLINLFKSVKNKIIK